MSHTTVVVPSVRGGDPSAGRRAARLPVAGFVVACLAGLMLLATPAAHADTVTVTIPADVSPRGVAITPDGNHAYVTNDRQDGTVSVIDISTNTVTTTIQVGQRPNGVAVTPDGTRAYVANADDGTVSVIDTATNTVTTTIEVAASDRPRFVVITPDGNHAYVSLSGVGGEPDRVSVIDTRTNTVTTTVRVETPLGVAVTPDGTLAYVVDADGDSVSVIDTATQEVVDTVPVGNYPYQLAIAPDGTRAYVTNTFDDSVSVIDTATRVVIDTVPVGNSPNGVAVTPDGTLAYVTNDDHTVSVIDTTTNTVTTTVPVGRYPFGVAITPDGTHTYVTNLNDSTVSVIAIGTPELTGTPPAGTVSQPYQYTFTLVGRPAPTTTVTAGALPDGLTLSSDGILSGTPTAAGLFEFTLTAGNGIGDDAVLPVAFDVQEAPVLNGEVPAGIVGQPFRHTFILGGRPAPTTTVTAGTLPDGLALGADGILSGTPTARGQFTFTVTATNGVGEGVDLPVDLTIVGTPALTGTPPTGEIGQPYTHAFTLTGDPAPHVTVTAGALPDGMTLTSGGVLAGTPTASGQFTFTVTADNGNGHDVRNVDLAIVGTAALTGTPPTGEIGQPYAHAFTLTGYPAPHVTVTAGALPDGLTLTSDGVLAGTPTATGRFEFTVTATNGIGEDVVLPVVLDITDIPPTGPFGSLQRLIWPF
ncbi:YncE family protein [Rhodococcus spongiicola]|uniref:YncE family protein n=1 Tax=Rhodococcus spongiicola TaxID=2487352 RepID=A0A3S3AQQ7_9NOCA|nr:YncE family protein [Rhodococcus spongiicola]RVW06157.1 YncE family protein [Rhodococcus spongiicola]